MKSPLLINSFYHFTAYLATALYHFYDPLVSLITHLISSNTSGLSFSLSFILSFIAMMIVFALSSAPCFELFSAAPVSNNFKLSNDFQNFVVSIQWLIKFNFYSNVDQKKGNWWYCIMHKWQKKRSCWKCKRGKLSSPPPLKMGIFLVWPFLIPHFYAWGCTNSKI